MSENESVDADLRSVVTNQHPNNEEKRKRHAEKMREWRKKNPEKYAAYWKKWLASNRDKANASVKRYTERLRSSPEGVQKIIARNRKKNTSDEGKRRRKENNQEIYGKSKNAINHKKRWSDWEIELIFDTSMNDREIATEIGRSRKAIELARIRYAERAPQEYLSKRQSRLSG